MKSKNNVITGNYFNKYKSKILLYRILVNHYKFTLQSLIQDIPIDTCLEIGSGEGYIIDYILSTKPEIQIFGSDIGFSRGIYHLHPECDKVIPKISVRVF